MDPVQLGSTIRTARVRKRWRQADLARAARVSRSTISRIERGHLRSLPLGVTLATCAALEIRLDLVPRWRGGDLGRMLALRHSQLHESVARVVRTTYPRWQLAPETSFSIYGERGVIDLLLWYPDRHALLVVELKTELVDVNEMLGTMDRKRRVARQVAAGLEGRGWQATTVSSWIVLAQSRTNERRMAEHRTMLRAAHPADGRQMRAWLRDPVGSISALSLWPADAAGGRRLGPTCRVNRAQRVPLVARARQLSPNVVRRMTSET